MSTEPTQISAEGLAQLKAELEQLETVSRKEISERIKIARDFGDLKENSEYHDAKNEQAFLETKILRLRERLNSAVVMETEQGSHAQFGSTVKLLDEESGKEQEYKLVGATEASLAEGKLSVESPVAQAIIGKMAGDTAVVSTPRGERRYKLISVATLLLALVALLPSAVGAAIPRPASVSPKNGAVLPVGKTPTFKVKSTGKGTVWLHVSKSSKRKADGVIGNDASITQMRKKGGYFVIKPKFFDYPGFWANQKRKWYWQSYRIACGDEAKSSDCKVEGPVRSFTLR